MRSMVIFGVLIIGCFSADAQQYGWVNVANLGNQFTALQSVEFVDSLHGWTAYGAIPMYRTTDGGLTWTPYDAAAGFGVSSISMFDSLAGWAVGTQSAITGKIIRTTDGGRSWDLQRVVDYETYLGTTTLRQNHNLTIGYKTDHLTNIDTGILLQTTDGGVTYNGRTFADSIASLYKIQFVDSLHGWSLAAIRTQVGGILRTVDGGNSWACHVTPELFYAISFIDTSNGFVTKGNSPIFTYRTVDGGRTWHVLGQIFDPLWGDPIINALSFTDSLYGWAFGIMFYQGDLAGVVFHTTDGGMSWYLEHVGQTRRMNDGFMLDRFHGWAVGDQGAVFAYAPVSTAGQKLPELPIGFSLKQNYPNPFNPSTRIEYEVQRRALVKIAVYDMIGRKVAQLVDGEHEPGVYQVNFEADGLASGVYVYTMTSGTFSESKQMVIIK